MDAFLTFLIDGVFFMIGKGFWWLLKKAGLDVPEFGHWSYVVLGFVIFIAIGLLIFLTWGALNV